MQVLEKEHSKGRYAVTIDTVTMTASRDLAAHLQRKGMHSCYTLRRLLAKKGHKDGKQGAPHTTHTPETSRQISVATSVDL